MVKIAQYTEFDKLVQPREHQWNKPKQRLLFPGEPRWTGDTSNKEEDIEAPEKPREELDLSYPEIEPEHIKTNVSEDIAEYNQSGEPRTKEDLDVEKLNKDARDKVLAKYNKLRQTAITFYAAYKEANSIASSDDYVLDISGTYADLFSNYGKLITHRLTQEIGRLFGGNLKRYNSLQYYFNNGINIFNITDKNYASKINELERLIAVMNEIITDYENRKKLLKYLGPKIQEESDRFLQNPETIKFLTWMDEYFPNYKADVVRSTFSTLESGGYRSTHTATITLRDLVKFKTFKSIYEKAQHSTSNVLKDSLEYSVVKNVREEVQSQLYDRVTRIFISLARYLGTIDNKLSAEEQCNQVILFLRKNLNIDVRSIFTFSTNASKKQITLYYESSASPEGISPEQHKENIQNAIDKDAWGIYQTFIKQLEYYIKNFLEKNKNDDWVAKWGLKGSVEELVNKIIGHYSKIDIERYTKLLQSNSKDFDRIAVQFVYNFILKSIQGLNDASHYDTGTTKKPAFGGIAQVVSQSDGKFSIEAFTNYANQSVPFVQKEMLTAVIKAMFRELDYKSLNTISLLGQEHYRIMTRVICNILQKDNKLNHDNFYKLFKNITVYAKFYGELRANFPSNFDENDMLKTIIGGIRNYQTIDQDLNNLVVFAKFIHNEAGSLSDDIIRRIISNKNFVNFNKIGIVKKLFKSYTQIKNNLGINGIYEKYGKLITSLRQRKYISPNFRENLLLITKFFESNEEINPASPLFSKLFDVASQIETDLGILEMGDTLKDLLTGYKPKSPNLFALDYALRPDLRFRVLGDRDPRILRVGIETSCCQRIGGVGATAARDSFVNPLSSVLLLEWKDPIDNDWKLLTQSYFHYVPADGGYILDNVETNSKNVGMFQAKNTDMSLEDIYAVYAAEIKNKLDVPYFLAGKGYSKISTYKFNTSRRDDDPRYFDNRALENKHDDHYSDYDEHNGMDLLSPTFNIEQAKDKVFAQAVKKSHLQIRRFIQSILRPPGLQKFAQTTNTPTTTPPLTTTTQSAPSHEDIKTLAGVDIKLFGPRSWQYINKFMNELNIGLFTLGGGQKLGNQSLNFQAVVKNPSAATRYIGGLKSLFKISTRLWEIVSVSRSQPYTMDDSLNIINNLMNEINSSNFPETAAQEIKPKLITILNQWKSILK